MGKRRFLGMFLMSAFAASVALSACTFGWVAGMAQVTPYPARGMLSLSKDGDRVYVGVQSHPNGLRTDIDIHAFDENGTLVTTLTMFSPFGKPQAMTTDPTDDSVLTLHADGIILRWTKDLVFDEILVNKVPPPPANADAFQYCDVTVINSSFGTFTATGIALIDGEWHRVQSSGGSSWNAVGSSSGQLAWPREGCIREDRDEESLVYATLHPDKPHQNLPARLWVSRSHCCGLPCNGEPPVTIDLPEIPNIRHFDVATGA